VSSAEAYQMHAYASAYGCHDVRLLHPWHSDLLGFAGHVYELATTGTTKPLLRLGFVDVKRSPLMLVGVDLGQQG
jgi:hypothetical protein